MWKIRLWRKDSLTSTVSYGSQRDAELAYWKHTVRANDKATVELVDPRNRVLCWKASIA